MVVEIGFCWVTISVLCQSPLVHFFPKLKMKWDMQMEEIEAILDKIWDLHNKLSDAIYSVSRSQFLTSLKTLKNSSPLPNFTANTAADSSSLVFVKDFRPWEPRRPAWVISWEFFLFLFLSLCYNFSVVIWLEICWNCMLIRFGLLSFACPEFWFEDGALLMICNFQIFNLISGVSVLFTYA